MTKLHITVLLLNIYGITSLSLYVIYIQQIIDRILNQYCGKEQKNTYIHVCIRISLLSKWCLHGIEEDEYYVM